LKGVVFLLEVTVHQNQVDKALKALKRQMTKEGLLKELKRRRFYEKPSVKKKRKQKEAKKKRKSAMRRSFS
jgi:small subunit ribosomal protein S21